MHELLIVEKLVGLVVNKRLVGVAHRNAPRLGALAEGLAQHIVEIDHADMGAGHARNFEAGKTAAARVRNLDFDLLIVELAVAQPLAEGFLGGWAGVGAHQRVQDALLGQQMRLCAHLLALAGAHKANARLDEVADDLIDVAADIADLGKLRCLDLEERRIGQLGEPARNLRLADAGWADHEDVLRQHLLAHVVLELLPAPAIAKRNCHGPFRVGLADDEPVELRDDFPRGEVCHVVFPSVTASRIKRPMAGSLG